MKEFSFEKLDVWQKTRLLVKDIYVITKDFPKSEDFNLTSQLRRAVISVMSNIAEGSSRFGDKNQINFYQIAFSSLMEIMSQLIVSNDLGYIDENELILLREKVIEVSNKLNSLYQSIKDNK